MLYEWVTRVTTFYFLVVAGQGKLKKRSRYPTSPGEREMPSNFCCPPPPFSFPLLFPPLVYPRYLSPQEEGT